MNYLIIDKQFLILCKFIIIGSDILFNRLCLFRRVGRLFGGFSARFTDLGANKCMPDRQFIRLHLNLCRQNTFHSANIFLYFFFHQGDVTLRFLCREACGFESHYPYQNEHHPCFEIFYRNTDGFLFGKPRGTRLSAFFVYSLCISGNIKMRRCFYMPALLYEHGFLI